MKYKLIILNATGKEVYVSTGQTKLECVKNMFPTAKTGSTFGEKLKAEYTYSMNLKFALDNATSERGYTYEYKKLNTTIQKNDK